MKLEVVREAVQCIRRPPVLGLVCCRSGQRRLGHDAYTFFVGTILYVFVERNDGIKAILVLDLARSG